VLDRELGRGEPDGVALDAERGLRERAARALLVGEELLDLDAAGRESAPRVDEVAVLGPERRQRLRVVLVPRRGELRGAGLDRRLVGRVARRVPREREESDAG